MLKYKIVNLRKIYNFCLDCFSKEVLSFLQFIKNVLIEIKNSIIPPKYIRYGKNVRIQNGLSQKDLQHWY